MIYVSDEQMTGLLLAVSPIFFILLFFYVKDIIEEVFYD